MTAPIDLEALRGHTPGPWTIEVVKNEGMYGDGGPDGRSGFDSYCVQDAQGRVLFDTLNSDYRVASVHEDAHDEGVTAWDEQGRVNLTLAAAAPDLLAELTTRRARDAEVEALVAATGEWLLQHSSEAHDRLYEAHASITGAKT
jgi:hypothetical protein